MKKHYCIQSFRAKSVLMRCMKKIPLAMRCTLFMLFCLVGMTFANVLIVLLSYPDGDQGTGKRHFAGTGCLRADAMDADSCLQLRWVPVFLFDAAFQNV